jgi:c(7)-type cytochrome triheme protein
MSSMILRRPIRASFVLGLLIGLGVWGAPQTSRAEYGDVVINNYADAAGMRPVVFPHWFHRIRFRCKVCHADLGFKFKAGGNQITMAKIIDGKLCGACHNGEIAWSVENCAMCHSGIPGTPTHFHGSTVQRLVAPAYKPLEPAATGAQSAAGATPPAAPGSAQPKP